MIKAIKETLKALVPDSPKKALLELMLLIGLVGKAYASDIKKPDNVICKDGVCLIEKSTATKEDYYSKIAFDMIKDTNSPRNREVYLVNPNGNNLEKITTNPSFDGQPAWSPKGNELIYIAALPKKGFTLCSYDLKSKKVKELVSKISPTSTPDWGSGGIAFEKNFEVYVLNKNGEIKKITQQYAEGNSRHACLEPRWIDNERLLYLIVNPKFSTGIKDSHDIAINDGKIEKIGLMNPRVIVPPKGDYATYGHIRLSNDKRKIVFASEMDPHDKNIINNDERLDMESPKYDFLYHYDAFMSHSEIYTAAIKDGKIKNIERLTNNQCYDGSPTLSPDGTKIAFVSRIDGKDYLKIMDANGKNERTILALEKGRIFNTSWSPYMNDKADDGLKVNSKNIEKQMKNLHFYSNIKFDKIVNNDLSKIKGKNSVVEVYADWCEFCPENMVKVFMPASKKYSNKGIDFLVMDFDKNKELGKKFNIKSLPTVLYFDKKGALVYTQEGCDLKKAEETIQKYYINEK